MSRCWAVREMWAWLRQWRRKVGGGLRQMSLPRLKVGWVEHNAPAGRLVRLGWGMNRKKVVLNLTKMWTMQSVRSPICQHSASGPFWPHNTQRCLILCSSTHIPCPYVPSFTHHCTSLASDFCHREIMDYITVTFLFWLQFSNMLMLCLSSLCMYGYVWWGQWTKVKKNISYTHFNLYINHGMIRGCLVLDA